MTSRPVVVTVPNVTLTFEQLLTAVRQLDEEARAELARALLETDLDAKLADLIRRLAEREPADDVSDAMIDAEIRSVRESHE